MKKKKKNIREISPCNARTLKTEYRPHSEHSQESLLHVQRHKEKQGRAVLDQRKTQRGWRSGR
jgi:ribosomal protein L34